VKLIAHRGNISGPNSDEENNPSYIDTALKMSYDVEIDLRYEDQKFYLGHDQAQYKVSQIWLIERKNNLWIHCKDLNSLSALSETEIDFNYFWHQNDDFTLTSKNYIWTYPGKQFSLNSIIVVPESNTPLENLIDILDYDCFGVCSDYLNYVKN
jgi:hypothetical protein